MMKRSVLSLAVALSMVPALSNAAEIYNKDGNKLCKYPWKTNHSLLEIFRHTDYVPWGDRYA